MFLLRRVTRSESFPNPGVSVSVFCCNRTHFVLFCGVFWLDSNSTYSVLFSQGTEQSFRSRLRLNSSSSLNDSVWARWKYHRRGRHKQRLGHLKEKPEKRVWTRWLRHWRRTGHRPTISYPSCRIGPKGARHSSRKLSSHNTFTYLLTCLLTQPNLYRVEGIPQRPVREERPNLCLRSLTVHLNVVSTGL